MGQSDKKLQTNNEGAKTRQTRHWDWDYMTRKQQEALIRTTKRDSSKKNVRTPFRESTRR